MTDTGFQEVEGFRLAYRIVGKGQPVLVVGSEVYYPRLFSPELSEALQLIHVDHRGFAEAPAELMPEAYALDRVVDDLEVLRARLGLEDLVVMGHSGHAFMATEYAIRYPRHVRQLVLLNSAPTNSPERQQQSMAFFEETASPERKRQFEADIAMLAGDIEREPDRRFAHMVTRMGALGFYDFKFDGSALWDGVRMHMPILDHLWGDAFGRIDLIERLASLDKPVFLGLGRYDYLVGPVSLWDAVETRCPHVTKVVFEHSGHNPMLEQSADFDARLLDWLRQGASRPARG